MDEIIELLNEYTKQTIEYAFERISLEEYLRLRLKLEEAIKEYVFRQRHDIYQR